MKVGAFTQIMVTMDHHFDNLKRCRQAGWKTPADHPDLDPTHEALQLLEQYRELRRQPAMMRKPKDFQALLHEAETGASELESNLRKAKHDKPVEERTRIVEKVFQRVTATCNACHAKYRD